MEQRIMGITNERDKLEKVSIFMENVGIIVT